MNEAISQDPERCQFPFCLMRNPLLYRAAAAGERSGGARNLLYRAARSNSGRAAPSVCVGNRFSAGQIVWNRSTRPGGAAGRGSIGQMAEDLDDHRRIFDGGPSDEGQAAMIFKALPQFGQSELCIERLSR